MAGSTDNVDVVQQKGAKKNKKYKGAPGWKQKKLEEMRQWRNEMKEAKRKKKLQVRGEASDGHALERNLPTKSKSTTTSTDAEKLINQKPCKTKKKANTMEMAQEERPAKKKRRTSESAHQAAAVDSSFVDPEAFKVCVAGLASHVNEELLRKDFSECGEILNLRLLRDRESGKSRGIAFISFTNQVALDAALAYDGEQYGGRSLWVKIAEKGKAGKGKGGTKGNDTCKSPQEKPAGCTTVILRGLAYSVVDDDLMNLFKSCGKGPSNVDVLCDRETGASRGIAFIDFDDEDAVDEAIKLNGSELKGRCFHVGYATPRAKNDKGPGEKPPGCTSVLLKGLAYTVTDAHLMKIFKSCDRGPTNVRMVMDNQTGTSRGMAFVDFDSESAVDAAIKLHGTELQGRPFIVEYARTSSLAENVIGSAKGEADRDKSTLKGPEKKPAGCTSVTVKGLYDSVTEKKLMKMFKSCGEGPRNVNFVMDKDTGAFSGLAFVNFSSEVAVEEAMKLNGTELKGQSIIMGYVKPKKRQK